jgi:hypothetical protein
MWKLVAQKARKVLKERFGLGDDIDDLLAKLTV